MDSLFNILANKDFTPPDDITALKKFITNKYNQPVEIAYRGKTITIQSPSAALISSLRLDLPQLQKQLSHPQPIRLSIG